MEDPIVVTVGELKPEIAMTAPGNYAVSVDETEVQNKLGVEGTSVILEVIVEDVTYELTHNSDLKAWAIGKIVAESQDAIEKAVVTVK